MKGVASKLLGVVAVLGLAASPGVMGVEAWASPEGEAEPEPLVSDPIWAELEDQAGADTAEPLPYGVGSSAPIVMSNAITGAAIDVARGQVYAASRSASPASFFENSLETGESEGRTDLPPGATGAWDAAVSGDTVAVGLNQPGGSTGVAQCTLAGCVTKVVLPKSRYVMSLVEDTFLSEPGNGRYFWAGTYDASGGQLFRVDLETGGKTNYTPAQWAADDYRYVRSLASDSQGVTIGLGNRAHVWRLTSATDLPVAWGEAEEAVADGATVYAAATFEPRDEAVVVEETAGRSLTQEMGGPEEKQQSDVEMQQDAVPSFTDGSEGEVPQTDTRLSYSLLGTNSGGPTLVVVDNNSGVQGEVVAAHRLEDAITIDRITVNDETAMAWLSTRPFGDIYSLDLTDPSKAPVHRTTPVRGAETRALAADGKRVFGVTGTGDIWAYRISEGTFSVLGRVIQESSEFPEATVQGLAFSGDRIFIGGHWRYQVIDQEAGTSQSVALPGEPKTQVIVGDSLYSAIYPSATIGKVTPETRWVELARLGHGQTRPSDIDYSDGLGKLLIATGPEYGSYGGGVSLLSLDGRGGPDVYTSPVGEHRVQRLVAVEDGAILGTATSGEAVPALPGEEAFVARWRPSADDPVAGETVWEARLGVKASSISGLTTVEDVAGEYVLATTANGYAFGLSLADGSVLWEQKIGSAVGRMSAHEGYIVSVVDGKAQRLTPSRTAVLVQPISGVTRNLGFLSLDASAEGHQQRLATVGAKPNVEAQVADLGSPRNVVRASGATRYSTAVAVSKNSFETADTVILVRGNLFPDALSAGPLAAYLEVPILLVRGDSVDAETAAEIERLGAKRALPVGGYGAVPRMVKGLPKGVTLDNGARLRGEDRYGTSAAVAKKLQELRGNPRMPLVAATGTNFADAVSAGPAASAIGGAVMLVGKSGASESALAPFLDGRRIDVVGGPAARTLQSMGIKANKSSVGKDRYETSAEVANTYFGSPNWSYLASGRDFPDALTAAAPAGMVGGPVLLSSPMALPASAKEALAARKAHNVLVSGGTGAIGSKVLNEVQENSG